MATIAVLIDDFFEDSEYTDPARDFREAGHELVHLGLKPDSKVSGKRRRATVMIDRAVRDAAPDDYDALFIPGGYSPDRLRAHEDPVRLVRDFVNSGKPVFLICHAPQLLINADVVRGRKMTGWKSILKDLKNAGADVRDEAVVEDGNLISSRGPDDIPEFTVAALKALGQRVHV